MNANKTLPGLLIIAGPTASGKSDLSFKLAELLDGEIISADSAQVYRGLDIGTAKPERIIQEKLEHHFLPKNIALYVQVLN